MRAWYQLKACTQVECRLVCAGAASVSSSGQEGTGGTGAAPAPAPVGRRHLLQTPLGLGDGAAGEA